MAKEKIDNKLRNSNFEVMRILSMFFIVIWHFLYHGDILGNTNATATILVNIISAVILVHVNSFILLSGYFNYDKEIKFTKIIKLNNQVWFYGITIMILFILLGTDISKLVIFHTLLPIGYNNYWFFSCYIILYIISPILNIIIKSCDKKNLGKVIATCFILFSILPTITNGSFYNVANGYSIISFVLLYFIGAYLKKYIIIDNCYIKIFNKKVTPKILLILFFIVICFNLLLYYLGLFLNSYDNSLCKDISEIFRNGFFAYSSPTLILQSIIYLLIFSTFNFKNKMINKIAACTFGVYLISDNFFVRNWLYTFLGFNKQIYNSDIFLFLFLEAMAVFVFCTLIEMVRLYVFKLVYNSKLAKKNRALYKNFVENIELKINY